MKIDAHQHFWHYSPVEHVWMDDRMAVLKKDYLPADLQPLLQAAGFDGCVAVQARQSLVETRWLLRLAEENNFIKGVVGWVDLRADEVDSQIDEFARNPRLVGVRHVVHDEPDDEFMLGAAFQRGLSRLASRGLVYDLLLFPKHLPVAVELVANYPEQIFVLDHIAKPLIADGILCPWREDIRELARFPNVSCKLSGMVTEAKWKQWKADDFSRYLDVVMEAFGPDRLMIGSDWPVCTLSASYSDAMGLVREFVAHLPEADRAAILGGTCARVYGIGKD